MKKNIISILFCIMLLISSCASSKPTTQKPTEHPIETVDKFGEGNSKGLMELLIAGLIFYSLSLMITR